MGGQRRILVAVDISELSERLVEHAVRNARPEGWRIDLIHVLQGPLPTSGYSLPFSRKMLQELEDKEQEVARHLLDVLMEHVPEELRGEKLLVTGDPALKICEQAEDYELLVLATHGRTGLQHMLLGSVAEEVVRRAPIPVLVVR